MHIERVATLRPVATPFDFRASVRSHGWIALAPFEWDQEKDELSRVQQLSGGRVVRMRLSEDITADSPGVQLEVDASGQLTADEREEVVRAASRMLRLDEDFTPFYQLVEALDGDTPRLQPGGGRLLRCPTLFEDIVCTLCTTNITWAGTKRLAEKLVSSLGAPFAGGGRAFPTAEAIAGAGLALLRDEVRLGYRSEYVWQLASDVAQGKLDLRTFEDPEQPTDELYRALRRIKGVGDYAAATLLMILGRYDRLAIDSALRSFASRRYFNGHAPSDAEIRAIYAPWKEWKYLAYWFDPETS